MSTILNKEQAVALIQSFTIEFAIREAELHLKEMHDINGINICLNQLSKELDKKDDAGNILEYKVM